MSFPETKRRSPYQGLIPYGEQDAPFFFGREKETRLITANLFASPLTLLYGASGVGKSSVLRAGVARQLRGRDDLLVVVFNSWQGNPVADLMLAIAGSAGHNDPATDDEIPDHLNPGSPAFGSLSLTEYLQACYQQTGRRLMIILDQFEEYFLYHPLDDEFASEFSKAVTKPEAPVSFLISIREDFYAKLDRFEGRIPALYDNYLRIEHLDRTAARIAIEKPIAEYNRLYAADGQFSIEPELVTAVLRQVETGQVIIGEAGRGVVETARSEEDVEAQIETPFLQLVMTRLWEKELDDNSHKLRLATLQGLGGAENIVRTHLDAVISKLTPDEQEIAANIFHYLVTPSGTKIAYTASDLAGSAKLSEAEVMLVLEKLSHGVRILRPVDPTLDRPEAPRYEIFHDVLAPAILTWRTAYVQAQERADAERRTEEQRLRADEQARVAGRFRRLAVGLAVMILLALGATVFAFTQTRKANANAVRADNYAKESDRLRKEGEEDKKTARNERERAEKANDEARRAQDAAAVAEQATQEQIKVAELKTAEARKAESAAQTASLRAAAANAKATSATKEAEQQASATRVAFSNLLSVQSATLLDAHPQLSTLLAVEALSATKSGDPRVPAAEEALRRVLASTGGRALVSHRGIVEEVRISPDNHWLISRSGAHARIVDLTGTAKPRTLSDVSAPVVISPDSRWLITGSKPANETATADKLILRDLITGESVAEINVGDSDDPNNPIKTVLVSRGARWLIVARGDAKIRLWNLMDVKAPAKLLMLEEEAKYLSALAVSPDGHWLFASSGDKQYGWEGKARLWDLTTNDPAAGPIDLEIGRMMMTRVAFSDDSKFLAAGSSKFNPRTGEGDKLARVWSLQAARPSPKPWRTLDNKDSVNALALSRRGRTMFTAGKEIIRQWDLTTPDRPAVEGQPVDQGEVAETATVTFSLPISEMTVSPDGRNLAVVGAGKDFRQVFLFEAASFSNRSIDQRGTLTLPFDFRHSAAKVDFSQDSRLLVGYNSDNTATVWDLNTDRKLTLRGHDAIITSAAFSPDGQWLATGSEDQTTRLWDLAANAPNVSAPLVLQTRNEEFFLSPDQRWLITRASEKGFNVWDLKLEDVSRPFAAVETGFLHDVAFTTDGHWMVSGHDKGETQLWDLTAPDAFVRPKRELTGHKSVVSHIAISSDNHLLATGSYDGTVRLWDLANPEVPLIRILPEAADEKSDQRPAIFGVHISSDNRWLVTRGNPDSLERLWDLRATNPTASSKLLGPNNGFALSPDSHWLYIQGKKDSGRLWNLKDTSAIPLVLDDVRGPFLISPDSRWLIISSAKDTPRLWNLKDPLAAPATLSGHKGSIEAMSFSPDSQWLAVGGDDKTPRLWKLSAAGPASEPLSLPPHQEPVTGLFFRPDSRMLITSGNQYLTGDGTTRLWDLTSGSPADTAIIFPTTGSIRNAAFVEHGLTQWLVTGNRGPGSGTYRVELWNMRLEDLRNLACRVAARNLTDEEWKKYFPGQPRHVTCPMLPAGQ